MAAGVWLAPARQSDLSEFKFTPLARDEATESYPAWSPDGKSIACIENVHGVRLGTILCESPQTTWSERLVRRV
jgi:hypothetical protein